MNALTAETMQSAARYFYADKPRETEQGCRVETRYTACDHVGGAFVGVVEHVTLACPKTDHTTT